MIYFPLFVVLSMLACMIYIARKFEVSGRNEAENNQIKEELEDERKARQIRIKLERDAAYAEWLRKRFTR
jgi:Na+-transporting methylmalonyl-CoA/oxaloacetate decarboxylase gamma subunit